LCRGLGGFIGSNIKRNQYRKSRRADGRKSNRKKTHNDEEERRDFTESFEENPREEDPVLDRQFCIHSISTVAKIGCSDPATSWRGLNMPGGELIPFRFAAVAAGIFGVDWKQRMHAYCMHE
jgi:hypothetical protein